MPVAPGPNSMPDNSKNFGINQQPPGAVSSISAPPQDIAESFSVSSGAFKVVALTKEQLR